jgi:hypothetical protein
MTLMPIDDRVKVGILDLTKLERAVLHDFPYVV